jgi:hypothetical protein
VEVAVEKLEREVKRMKIKIALVLALTLLMLLAAVAPVLACQPKTNYSFGAIALGNPNTGTTSISANKIVHERNVEGISYDFGHPWGPGFSTTISKFDFNKDPNSRGMFKGSGVENIETGYQTGFLKIRTEIKMEGVGYYTYQGPLMIATMPYYGDPYYGKVTVSYGDVFYGILIVGTGEGRGTFADGKVKVEEKFSGVAILSGPLTGLNVVSGTGKAMKLGHDSETSQISATSVQTSKVSVSPLIIDTYKIYVGVKTEMTVTLNLPDETLVGTSSSLRTEILKLPTPNVLIFFANAVWTFPEGTFEGKPVYQINNYNGIPPTEPWIFTVFSWVLHGTGAFEGQTIVLSSPTTGYIFEN